MSDSDSGEKTEEPSDKKRQEALKEGQFAKAPEIGIVFVLTGALVYFAFYVKDKAIELAYFARGFLGNLGEFDFTLAGASNLMNMGLQGGLYVLLPFLIATTLAAIVAGGLQSGFKMTLDVIKLRFDKLSPVTGFKRIFSKSALVQLGIDGMKFFVIGYLIYAAIQDIIKDPIFYTTVPVTRLLEFMLEVFIKVMIRLVVFLGIIAIINYCYQRYKTTQDLKMTKQELKDERKSAEGDAMVKGARQRMAQRMMQKQMMDEVPTADVVVANPTHFAVALKYERGKDRAPIILAKGQDLFALKIKEIAKKHEVPISENKIAARLLFKLGKVGETIPAELYQVVAEILSFVYKKHKYYFHKLKARRENKK